VILVVEGPSGVGKTTWLAQWDRTAIVAEHGRIDPPRLSGVHYDYCRARSGSISWAVFESGVHACRNAIARRRLGIADRVLCEIPDATTLDARKRGDPSRTRRNFDLHREFGPALHDWYGTLEALEPGRVDWTFPAQLPPAENRDRYNLDLFDSWMIKLPRSSSTAPRITDKGRDIDAIVGRRTREHRDVTTPLPYQSNSGPAPSLSSAMNPPSRSFDLGGGEELQ